MSSANYMQKLGVALFLMLLICVMIISFFGSKSMHTSASSVGGTRYNPVPVGQPLKYKSQELTVLDAWEEPYTGFFSDEYDRWVYVRLQVTFLQDPNDTDHISQFDFRLVGSSGKISDNLEAAPDDGLPYGEYFGGSTIEGNIRAEVMEGDTDFVLIWQAGIGVSKYFSLGYPPLEDEGIDADAGASDGDEDSNGGCFIASAAYGTSTANELDTLRSFRDEVLLRNNVGSRFVGFYYANSPPLADFISKHEVLRTIIRELVIDPIVWIVKATEYIWRN